MALVVVVHHPVHLFVVRPWYLALSLQVLAGGSCRIGVGGEQGLGLDTLGIS